MKSSLVKFVLAASSVASFAGCSSLYVGNVRFDKQEVCSKEYVSKLAEAVPLSWEFDGVHSDCLPPTTAPNVQRYYFSRFRLPIAKDEIGDGEEPPSPRANFLPSMIGRVFVADDVKDKDWAPPSTGNIFFLPGNKGVVNAVPTKRYVKANIAGIVEKQSSFEISSSAEGILAAALGQNTAALGKLKSLPSYEGILASVASFGLAKAESDMSQGQYHYFSIETNELASLVTALELCDWSMRVNSKTTKQSLFSSSGYPLGSPDDIDAQKIGIPKRCAEVLTKANQRAEADRHGDAFFSQQTINLIKSIERLSEMNPYLEHLGLVTGVAVIRTQDAKSNSCARLLTSFVGKNSGVSASKESYCDELRNALKTALIQADIATDGAAEQFDAKSLAINIDASYSKKSMKKMELEDHTSVLAIQWIPLDIRACKDPSKKGCKEKIEKTKSSSDAVGPINPTVSSPVK